MDESRGGWTELTKFAQRREEQNIVESGKGKARRKGVRELNSMGCSINYEKGRDQTKKIPNEGKKGRKNQGDLLHSK